MYYPATQFLTKGVAFVSDDAKEAAPPLPDSPRPRRSTSRQGWPPRRHHFHVAASPPAAWRGARRPPATATTSTSPPLHRRHGEEPDDRRRLRRRRTTSGRRRRLQPRPPAPRWGPSLPCSSTSPSCHGRPRPCPSGVAAGRSRARLPPAVLDLPPDGNSCTGGGRSIGCAGAGSIGRKSSTGAPPGAAPVAARSCTSGRRPESCQRRPVSPLRRLDSAIPASVASQQQGNFHLHPAFLLATSLACCLAPSCGSCLLADGEQDIDLHCTKGGGGAPLTHLHPRCWTGRTWGAITVYMDEEFEPRWAAASHALLPHGSPCSAPLLLLRLGNDNLLICLSAHLCWFHPVA